MADANLGVCGGCGRTLPLLANPYGTAACCEGCRFLDDSIVSVVRQLNRLGVSEEATAPIMRWLAQPSNWRGPFAETLAPPLPPFGRESEGDSAVGQGWSPEPAARRPLTGGG